MAENQNTNNIEFLAVKSNISDAMELNKNDDTSSSSAESTSKEDDDEDRKSDISLIIKKSKNTNVRQRHTPMVNGTTTNPTMDNNSKTLVNLQSQILQKKLEIQSEKLKQEKLNTYLKELEVKVREKELNK